MKREKDLRLLLISKSLDDRMKEDEMGVACSMRGNDENIELQIGQPEGKRLVVRPRRISEDTIKMDLRLIL